MYRGMSYLEFYELANAGIGIAVRRRSFLHADTKQLSGIQRRKVLISFNPELVLKYLGTEPFYKQYSN